MEPNLAKIDRRLWSIIFTEAGLVPDFETITALNLNPRKPAHVDQALIEAAQEKKLESLNHQAGSSGA